VRTAKPQANCASTRVGVYRRRGVPLLFLVFAIIKPVTITAQEPGITPVQTIAAIKWWHGAIVLGSLSALMLLDNPVEGYFQDNRSQQSNNVAATLRHIGQPEVYATVTLGLLGAGLISGDDGVTRAGGRLAATLALAGVAGTGLKISTGRPRPNASTDEDGFSPFSGQDAMPSGHTTMAFALATSLADDIHNRWASIGLYTLAAGVGWSRMNDHKHWLTDVTAGTLLGVTSAKLVNGHWRIFNLHPPAILLAPGQATLAWQFSF
jgi:membrane-associated phospholipid phosphatase